MIKKLIVTLLALSMLSTLVGCQTSEGSKEETNPTSTVTEVKTEDNTDTTEVVEESEDEETAEVKEEVTSEETITNLDLPGLNDEVAYFDSLQKYYDSLLNYDEEAYLSLRFYAKSDEGTKNEMIDEIEYVDGYIEKGLRKKYPSGMKTLTEVTQVTEEDGSIGYRVKVIYVENVKQTFENTEIDPDGENGHYITVAQLGYDLEDEMWKVQDTTFVDILYSQGNLVVDWMKYEGVSDDAGGWIYEYGKWYTDNFTVEKEE